MVEKVVPLETTRADDKLLSYDDLVLQNRQLKEELGKLLELRKEDGDQNVRVLVPVFGMIKIDTRDTLGASILSQKWYDAICFALFRTKLWYITASMWLVSTLVYTLVMINFLPADLAIYMVPVTVVGLMPTFITLNRQLAIHLSKRFELWFGMFNIIGVVGPYCLIFHDKRIWCMVNALPGLLLTLLFDALPEGQRNTTLKFLYPIGLVVMIILQFGFILNWYEVDSIEYHFMGIKWNAQSQISACMTNLMLFACRFTYTNVVDPRRLHLIKSGVVSTKMSMTKARDFFTYFDH